MSGFGFNNTGGFGQTNTGFGQQNQQNIGFGQQQRQNTGFGNQQQQNTGFGNQQQQNPGFGNQQQQNTGFGNRQQNPGFGNQQQQNPGFGNQQQQNTGFGNQQQNAGFGNQQQQNPGFGNQQQQNTGFGNQQQNAGFGGFGQTAAAPGANAGFSGFGQPAAAPNTGFGGFGQSTAGFGQPGANTGFGNNTAFGNTGFGNNTGFNNFTNNTQQQQQPTGFGFHNTAAASQNAGFGFQLPQQQPPQPPTLVYIPMVNNVDGLNKKTVQEEQTQRLAQIKDQQDSIIDSKIDNTLTLVTLPQDDPFGLRYLAEYEKSLADQKEKDSAPKDTPTTTTTAITPAPMAPARPGLGSFSWGTTTTPAKPLPPATSGSLFTQDLIKKHTEQEQIFKARPDNHAFEAQNQLLVINSQVSVIKPIPTHITTTSGKNTATSPFPSSSTNTSVTSLDKNVQFASPFSKSNTTFTPQKGNNASDTPSTPNKHIQSNLITPQKSSNQNTITNADNIQFHTPKMVNTPYKLTSQSSPFTTQPNVYNTPISPIINRSPYRQAPSHSTHDDFNSTTLLNQHLRAMD